jgi:CheY-like chemotaxis protein
MKVLVIDDNIAIQEILKDILKEEGHIAQIAGTIDDAVEAIIDFQPNAILLDTVVNGQDGTQALNLAHDRAPDVELNVILVKGLNEEIPSDNKFIKAVVNKPFKSSDISAALAALISFKEEEAKQPARKKKGTLFGRKKKKRPEADAEHLSVDDKAIVAEYIAAEGPMYGRSYVFFEPEPTKIYDFVNIFSPKDYATLIISSDNPKAVRQNYRHEDVEVATLTSSGRGKTMDINALGTLTVFIKDFIKGHDKPIIMIDNFTDIIDSNGLNHSLVFIHQLAISRPAGKVASFVISVDPSILTTKDRNIILGDMSEYSN